MSRSATTARNGNGCPLGETEGTASRARARRPGPHNIVSLKYGFWIRQILSLFVSILCPNATSTVRFAANMWCKSNPGAWAKTQASLRGLKQKPWTWVGSDLLWTLLMMWHSLFSYYNLGKEILPSDKMKTKIFSGAFEKIHGPEPGVCMCDVALSDHILHTCTPYTRTPTPFYF